MWTDVITVFQRYMGTGLVMIWFLAALLYLFFREERKERRILFVYVPVFLLLLYFNPVFAGLFCRLLGSTIYFRVCWLLPVILVIAYAAVCIYEKLVGKKQVLFVAALLTLLAVSGKLVYSNPLYSKAENPYHVPDSVVHICDAIVVPGREVMAAFPGELILYVRQYSPYVCMPYGREVMEGYWNGFYEAMQEEKADLEILSGFARDRECHYIILPEDKEILGRPQDYGWKIFERIDGYIIYRNTEISLEF